MLFILYFIVVLSALGRGLSFRFSKVVQIEASTSTTSRFHSLISLVKSPVIPIEDLRRFGDGVVVDGAEVTSRDTPCGAMRGMKASKTLSKGAPIVTLPFSACLVASSDNKNAPAGLDAYWSGTSSAPDRLAALLLQEWQRGIKSPWYNYINNLPPVGSRAVSPINWSADFLAAFPYLPLSLDVIKQQRNWKKLHDSLVSLTPTMQDIQYERFVWAMEAVTSRAFQGSVDFSSTSLDPRIPIAISSTALASLLALYMQSRIPDLPMLALCTAVVVAGAAWQRAGQFAGSSCALLPVIDSANHRSTHPSCSLSIPTNAKQFIMAADKPLSSGEEVTISYGSRHNDALLQYFGFVEQNNAFDRYVLIQASEKLEAVLAEDFDQYLQLHEGAMQSIREQDVEKLKTKFKKTDMLTFDLFKPTGDIVLESDAVFSQTALLSGLSLQSRKNALLRLVKYETRLLDRQTAEFTDKYSSSTSEGSELDCWLRLFLQERRRVLEVLCTELGKDDKTL